ncbi:MAG: flagella basal body P-ring formation protein FlgA, partial [Phycisphaerales bacterium]
MNARPRAIRLLAAALVALALAFTASADQVRLRASASVAPGPVRLADIATLDGPEAERLAEVTIEPDARSAGAERRVFEIQLAQVRAALDREDVHWGRVALSGASCIVRIVGDAPQPASEPETDAPERSPEPVTLDGPPTIRSRIGALLLHLFDVEAQDLRLLFDPRDEAFLATPEWGRRIDLQPNSTGSSGRQSITVRIFEGERLLEPRTVRVDARLRRSVVRLASGVARGETVGAGQVTLQELWIDPAEESPVGRLEDAVGMLARTRLDAGDLLRVGDIDAPLLVRRGDRVTVHCMSGGVALRANLISYSPLFILKSKSKVVSSHGFILETGLYCTLLTVISDTSILFKKSFILLAGASL